MLLKTVLMLHQNIILYRKRRIKKLHLDLSSIKVQFFI